MFTDAQVATILIAIDAGAPKPVLSSRTGLNPSELNGLLDELREKGLIDDSNLDSVVLTDTGKSLRNRLVHSKAGAVPYSFSTVATTIEVRAVDERLDQLISGLKV